MLIIVGDVQHYECKLRYAVVKRNGWAKGPDIYENV
jgi:hypothetical protein